MYLHDRHINFDAYYDEPDDPTPEEIAESEADYIEWVELEKQWKAADCKCKCGKPITLEDAYYYGMCSVCMDEQMGLWSAEEFQEALTKDNSLE